TTFAARGHIGWSWLVGKHFFVQAAIGASTGYETGRETTGRASYPEQPMLETHNVSRSMASPEGFFRIGGAFDINPGSSSRRTEHAAARDDSNLCAGIRLIGVGH